MLATVFSVIGGFFLFFYPGEKADTGQQQSKEQSFKLDGKQLVKAPVLGRSVKDVSVKGLVNQKNKSVSFEALTGKPILISFIYTRCPMGDMCPLITQKMVKVQEKVADKNLDLQFVSVSFDPEYDTPERLKSYGDKRNVDYSNWDFWTGSPKTIDNLIAHFNVSTKKDEKNDLINHNMRTYLIDRGQTIRYAWRGSKWKIPDVMKAINELQKHAEN